jgi:hypothetical protein
MLIATLLPNCPELHFGQRVIHVDQHSWHYHMVYMYKLSPKIQEVIEFQRWLIIKLILGKFSSENWVV